MPEAPLSPAQFRDLTGAGFLLGGFLAAWSSFELAIEIIVMRRLNLSPREASITMAGLGFGAKMNILYSLFADDPAYEEKLKKMRRAIDFAERNSFVHSFVVLREGKIVFVRREVKHKYAVKHKGFTLEEFHSHIFKFTELALEVQKEFSIAEQDLVDYGAHMLNQE